MASDSNPAVSMRWLATEYRGKRWLSPLSADEANRIHALIADQFDAFAREVDAYALGQRSPAGIWQPIETATSEKKVWSRVLVLAGGLVRTAMPSDTNAGRMWWCEATREYIVPTHWMPLPAPPPAADGAAIRREEENA